MNNIKIIYDTMNDLPENIDGKYDIDMLPTTIIFQGKEYKAGVDIDNDEFYKLLRDNKEIPTTSQVTYMTFKETFEKYVKEGKKVLYMAGSSKGSGTYQSAMLAKNDIESDDIYIFDTYSLCIGGGLLVLEAAKMVEEGLDIDTIIKKLEEYKDKVNIGKCDVDDNADLPAQFGVRNIPTVLFIKDGKVVDKQVGATTKAALKEKVEALLK